MQFLSIFLVSSLSVFVLADQDIHKLYKKHDYKLLYCEKNEQAVYVRYVVNKSDVFGTNARENNFKEDEDIETGSASLQDYRNSGYDRGHLKPAAVSKASVRDMDESFLMSNRVHNYLFLIDKVGRMWKL